MCTARSPDRWRGPHQAAGLSTPATASIKASRRAVSIRVVWLSSRCTNSRSCRAAARPWALVRPSSAPQPSRQARHTSSPIPSSIAFGGLHQPVGGCLVLRGHPVGGALQFTGHGIGDGRPQQQQRPGSQRGDQQQKGRHCAGPGQLPRSWKSMDMWLRFRRRHLCGGRLAGRDRQAHLCVPASTPWRRGRSTQNGVVRCIAPGRNAEKCTVFHLQNGEID